MFGISFLYCLVFLQALSLLASSDVSAFVYLLFTDTASGAGGEQQFQEAEEEIHMQPHDCAAGPGQ